MIIFFKFIFEFISLKKYACLGILLIRENINEIFYFFTLIEPFAPGKLLSNERIASEVS